MNITLHIENQEQMTALECALYIAKKQWQKEWQQYNTKINRQIVTAHARVYNQLYKYDKQLIKPKIKGINKKLKVRC